MTNQISNVSADSINTPYINRQYKDRLFRFVFSDKRDLLDLYNAINGTDYSDPEDLIITTLEDVVFLGMKNDVSFLIGSTLNLYEHQSTYSPNMPLRGLFYFADILRNYVEEQELDLYSSRRLSLPLPQFIVFYNGTQKQPDRKLLYLSESVKRTLGIRQGYFLVNAGCYAACQVGLLDPHLTRSSPIPTT